MADTAPIGAASRAHAPHSVTTSASAAPVGLTIHLNLQNAVALLGDVNALMQAAALLKARPDLVEHLCAIATLLMDDAAESLDALAGNAR